MTKPTYTELAEALSALAGAFSDIDAMLDNYMGQSGATKKESRTSRDANKVHARAIRMAAAARCKKDYVIRVAPAAPVSFLALASEEDEEPAAGPARTSDPDLALRFTNFQQARTELRAQVKRWPTSAFKMDVIEPKAAGAAS